MQSTKNKFVASVALIVFINLVLFLVVVFLGRATASKKELVFDIKRQLALYERRIEHVNRLEETQQKIEETSSMLETMFVDEDSLVGFIEELEFLARNAGVGLEIKGIGFTGEQNKKPVFTVSLTGSFENIYHYFILLENMIYKVEFNKVDIEKSSETGLWRSLLELKLLSFRNAQN